MKWFFTPPAETGPPPDHDGAEAPGLIGLPAALLHRHGARVLDPGKAAQLNRDLPLRPTVYRARTLLVPEYVLRDDDLRGRISLVLGDIGIELIPPAPDHRGGRGDMFRDLPLLPGTAVLAPVLGHPAPVVVDAWTALQTLRAAGIAQQQPERYREAVEQISLEHLMTGSAITGSPIDHGPGGIAGGPGNGGDVSGPTTTDSYLFSGGDPRTPIGVFLDPPARKLPGESATAYGRPPVVAVLDTGVRAHPWLDVQADGAGGYQLTPDGFVAIHTGLQDAIRAEGEHAVARGDKTRQVIRDAWDKPMTENPLIGEFNPALGHGTFIAGILRQVVPDARVLAVRVMHCDDVCYEGDIICALLHLAERIALAEEGDLAAMVDVVSLSFGYFSESPHNVVLTSGLWQAIKLLLDLGVVVVAAAGNYASSRKFYPAAFAVPPAAGDPVPVISVGALNPNGTKAIFSNDGPWVTAWALGAAVVSTYPVDVDASRTPELRIPVDRKPPGTLPPGRESLDPDDYSYGWAIWSGTSFSAPYLAARITAALLEGASRPGSGLRLDLPRKRATAGQPTAAAQARARRAATAKRKERAMAALEDLRKQEEGPRRKARRGEVHDGD